MKLGGFEHSEVQSWITLHRKITFRLLNDTVLTSLIRGVALAMVAHFIGGFFFSQFFSWSFCWSSTRSWKCNGLASFIFPCMDTGEPLTALVMIVLSLFFNYLISRARIRMGKKLHDQGAWLSFYALSRYYCGNSCIRTARICDWANSGNSSLRFSTIFSFSIERKNLNQSAS